MTTLSADSEREFQLGDLDACGVIASDIVYKGAAVGDNGSGYARPLSAGDPFIGFADAKVDNSSGSAGDKNVSLKKRGAVKLSVSGAVITDVGQPVYASDDDTFVFTPTSNSFIGFVSRFVSSGVVIVDYDAHWADPYGDRPRETLSDNKTLDAQDTGKVFFVSADAKTITLPATATAGDTITIVNIGAFGTVAVNVSPNANDKVMGPDVAGTDNKDLINTKATACRGDYVVLTAGHADGWTVGAIKGTWAEEA